VKRKKLFLTGATGNMGSETLKELLERNDKFTVRILVLDNRVERRKISKFKKKHRQDVRAYFPKNNKTDLTIRRHRIRIPALGWVQLKEYGYIPTEGNVKSRTEAEKAGRYHISVLLNEEPTPETYIHSEGIGIDLGIKEFATVNEGNVFGNINKSRKVRKPEKKLKREKRSHSRKILNRKRGETAAETRMNLDRNILRIQKLHQRLSNIRTEYIKSVVNTLVKTRLEFITIEDLNIKGMMKNRHLSKAIAPQRFYRFKEFLVCKCKQFGIELRLVGRFYP